MKDFFKKNLLLIIVFVTGAAVLVIEVVAVRILSPYFGNTIFTVSSILGVVLGALSLGYYLGGRLSDARPSLRWFYGIIFFSGLSVFLIQPLILFLLPILGYKLSIVNGPLISAIIMFFIPSFLLGMLSPFAIKLQSLRLPDMGVGKISGGVFFSSTLGSISGSLLAGFVLIPQFGIDKIIIYIGTLLLILGIPSLIKVTDGFIRIITKIIFIIIIFSVAVFFYTFESEGSVIYSKNGIYEKITIYDGHYNGRPSRFFKQDRSLSGLMFLDSTNLAFEYTKYFSLYKIFNSKIKNALVIGGGAYSVPKALLNDIPDKDFIVDVSEIEPSLFKLGKDFFNVPDDNRLNNYVEDGRRLLFKTKKKYDLIFSDVYYSLYSIPVHFTTKEFFEISKDKLSKDGVFIANVIGSLSRQEPSFLFSEIKTFKKVFKNSYFFAVNGPNNLKSQNIIFVGYNGDKKINFENLNQLNDKYNILSTLSDKLIDLNRFELSPYTELTDNFAPVEYLISKVISNDFSERTKLIDGKDILSTIRQQLRYGPRFLGAEGHKNVQDFLISEMDALSGEIKIQKWKRVSLNGTKNKLVNIIGRFFPEKSNRIILGTHYDSKKFAVKDKKYPGLPVPGANDSASGTAVLLEVARYFSNSKQIPNVGIDIIFFDGEEGEGDLDRVGWEPLGSKYFSENIKKIYPYQKPESGLVVDMVCDKNLFITQEAFSVRDAKDQSNSFFILASDNYPSFFNKSVGLKIYDDHTYLNKIGIPSFLIIDFDYLPFHTTKDTIDKCSPNSLEVVANSILNYIYNIR